MPKPTRLRTAELETYWVSEKLNDMIVKESNRVEQEDYISGAGFG